MTTVVVAQPVLTHDPANIKCPHCNADVVTAVEHVWNLITWLICCFVPCGLCIACCGDCAKETHHKCPNCNRQIGIKGPF